MPRNPLYKRFTAVKTDGTGAAQGAVLTDPSGNAVQIKTPKFGGPYAILALSKRNTVGTPVISFRVCDQDASGNPVLPGTQIQQSNADLFAVGLVGILVSANQVVCTVLDTQTGAGGLSDFTVSMDEYTGSF